MEFKEVFRKTLKISGKVFSVIFIISSIVMFFLFRDVNSFNQGFQTEEKVFLLDDGGLITGLRVTDFDDTKSITYFDDAELEILEAKYLDENYSDILDDSWKMFVIDSSVLRKAGEVEIDDEQIITNNQAFKILRSDNPNLEMFTIMYGDIKESQIQKIPDAELKANIFTVRFSQVLNDDPGIFYSGVKNKNIIIYPETILFKIVKVIPEKHIDKLTTARGED